MRYLKKFNEMLDPMGSWNPSQLNDKHEECEECGSYPCECNELLRKAFELDDNDEDDEEYDYRVKGIRPDYMAEEDEEYGVPSNYCPECDCIPCQCTGEEYDEDLRESQHKEGTFAYYNAMTKDELKSLEKSFKHDFENPAQHYPKFVAYLKASELKKVFAYKKEHIPNLKDNNFSRRIIY